jgi:hypothetical protein
MKDLGINRHFEPQLDSIPAPRDCDRLPIRRAERWSRTVLISVTANARRLAVSLPMAENIFSRWNCVAASCTQVDRGS